MALPIKTGFPDGITVSEKYIIRFRATDPSTGADVTGVKISNASLFSDSGQSVPLVAPEFDPVVLTPVDPNLFSTRF